MEGHNKRRCGKDTKNMTSLENKEYIKDNDGVSGITDTMCKLELPESNNEVFKNLLEEKEDNQTKKIESFADCLNKKRLEYIKENDKEVIEAVKNNEEWLLTKINNHRAEKLTKIEQKENTLETILEKIKTDSIVRSLFRKDFGKQSIHEKAQIEYIKNIYSDVYKLSAGTNGIYLDDSSILNEKNRPSSATKSLDIHSPSKKMYGILKYTKIAGGAQDNQFRDVKHFIKESVGYFKKNPNAEEIFVFYLDGPYYDTKRRNDMESMIPVNIREKVIITSCESIKL